MKPYFDRQGVTLYHGDCREVLPQLEPWDVCLTDPPFSEHVHFMLAIARSSPGTPNGRRRIIRAKQPEYSCIQDPGLYAPSFGRTLRWVAVFSDVESCHLWRGALTDSGLEYIRTGAWTGNGRRPQFTGDRPAIGFEAITIAHRPGSKRWNGGGCHALWTDDVIAAVGTRIVGEKPEPLMRRLVYLFSDEGETVLDAFAGSGTTLVAAYQLKRKAIGVEIREEACELTAKRLEREMAQIDLFAEG